MNNPIVSVIITHHLDQTLPYLEACVRSFLQSVGVDFEILVISDAPTEPFSNLIGPPLFDYRLKVFQDESLINQARKIDYAVKKMHPNSRFLFLANNDIIVNKYALKNMVESADASNCVINPLCNSDNTATWLGNMVITHPDTNKELNIPMAPSLELLGDFVDTIVHMIPPVSSRILWYQPWVPMYATCIPKKIWEEVGSWDEKLDLCMNDVDWCFRAMDLKHRCAIDQTAFVVHCQHRTLAHTETKDNLEEARKHFAQKRRKVMAEKGFA